MEKALPNSGLGDGSTCGPVEERRTRRRWIAVGLGLVLVSSACAVPRSLEPQGGQTAVAAAASASSLAIAGGQGVGGTSDPLAPPVVKPPVRAGKTAATKVNGRAGAFSVGAPVTYPDGVVVRVEAVKAGEERGQGPGAISGRPYVALTIEIDNKSAKSVDLNQVVVTTTYGSPARISAPVYDDAAAKDFSGTLAPGARASAVYLFAVPAQNRREVSTAVDFDAAHVAATFTGSVA